MFSQSPSSRLILVYMRWHVTVVEGEVVAMEAAVVVGEAVEVTQAQTQLLLAEAAAGDSHFSATVRKDMLASRSLSAQTAAITGVIGH